MSKTIFSLFILWSGLAFAQTKAVLHVTALKSDALNGQPERTLAGEVTQLGPQTARDTGYHFFIQRDPNFMGAITEFGIDAGDKPLEIRGYDGGDMWSNPVKP